MAIRASYMDDVVVGRDVMTSDRKRIGQVKDVRGTFFKVDAPMQRDFWLPGSLIQTCGEDMVLLSVAADSIHNYQLGEPGMEAGDDPLAAIISQPVISQEEMLEQRARMERELAEQSKHITPNEPSVTQIRGTKAWERIPADHAGFGTMAGEYVANAPVQDQIEHNIDRQLLMRKLRRAGIMTAIAGAVVGVGAYTYIRRRRRAKVESLPARILDRALSMSELAASVSERAQSPMQQVMNGGWRSVLREHLFKR